MNDLILNDMLFEKIKHLDDEENEFWYARESSYSKKELKTIRKRNQNSF